MCEVRASKLYIWACANVRASTLGFCHKPGHFASMSKDCHRIREFIKTRSWTRILVEKREILFSFLKFFDIQVNEILRFIFTSNFIQSNSCVGKNIQTIAFLKYKQCKVTWMIGNIFISIGVILRFLLINLLSFFKFLHQFCFSDC